MVVRLTRYLKCTDPNFFLENQTTLSKKLGHELFESGGPELAVKAEPKCKGPQSGSWDPSTATKDLGTTI